MDFNHLPEYFWWYLGGLFDGDGTVYVRTSSTLRLCITQASRNSIIIIILYRIFGGLYDIIKAKKITHQDTHRWIIEGSSAIKITIKLQNYVHLKKPQLILAATFPDQKGTYCIVTHSKTNEKKTFNDMHQCSLAFGLSKNAIANWQKGYRGCENKPKKVKEWDFEFITSKSFKNKKIFIESELKKMKLVDHLPISCNLNSAYCSGIFDSEGYIQVNQTNTISASVPQIYVSLLDALMKKYNGRINWATNKYRWTCIKNSRIFLDDIKPYSITKLIQISITLTLTRGKTIEISNELKKYKGHQDYLANPEYLYRNFEEACNLMSNYIDIKEHMILKLL